MRGWRRESEALRRRLAYIKMAAAAVSGWRKSALKAAKSGNGEIGVAKLGSHRRRRRRAGGMASAACCRRGSGAAAAKNIRRGNRQ
jgi:hypothetical protein